MAKKKDSDLILYDFQSELANIGDLGPEADLLIEQDSAAALGAGGWGFIRTSPSGFALGEDWEEHQIDCIVLANTRFHAYYEGAYVPDQASAPSCWAVLDTRVPGATEAKMAPTIENPQHHECHTCPQNAFGSADVGRGKACKNYQLLALLPAMQESDLEPSTLSRAVGRRLRLPPTSGMKWGQTAKYLEGKKIPIPFTIMRLSLEADKKNQFTIEAEPIGILGPEQRQTILERRDEALEQIMAPPPAPSAEESKTAKTRRTPAGRKTRKVSKKKATRKKITRKTVGD